jgi:hypothetical protein
MRLKSSDLEKAATDLIIEQNMQFRPGCMESFLRLFYVEELLDASSYLYHSHDIRASPCASTPLPFWYYNQKQPYHVYPSAIFSLDGPQHPPQLAYLDLDNMTNIREFHLGLQEEDNSLVRRLLKTYLHRFQNISDKATSDVNSPSSPSEPGYILALLIALAQAQQKHRHEQGQDQTDFNIYGYNTQPLRVGVVTTTDKDIGYLKWYTCGIDIILLERFNHPSRPYPTIPRTEITVQRTKVVKAKVARVETQVRQCLARLRASSADS